MHGFLEAAATQRFSPQLQYVPESLIFDHWSWRDKVCGVTVAAICRT